MATAISCLNGFDTWEIHSTRTPSSPTLETDVSIGCSTTTRFTLQSVEAVAPSVKKPVGHSEHADASERDAAISSLSTHAVDSFAIKVFAGQSLHEKLPSLSTKRASSHTRQSYSSLAVAALYFPAGQDWQEDACALGAYCPLPHKEQDDGGAAFSFEAWKMYFPMGHSSHEEFAVWKILPPSHHSQESFRANPDRVLNLPAGQGSH